LRLSRAAAGSLDPRRLSCYYSALGSRAVPFRLPSDSWGVLGHLARYELETHEGSCVRKTYV